MRISNGGKELKKCGTILGIEKQNNFMLVQLRDGRKIGFGLFKMAREIC